MSIEQIVKESREQWLGLRRKDVTASVAGALLGLHPYETRLSLYAAKVEDASDVAPDDENAAMKRGRLLEPVVVEMLRDKFPAMRFEPCGYYYRDTEARLGASPDVLAVDESGRKGIVQIKTVAPQAFKKHWKDEAGEIDVPAWIALQAIIEAKLTGAEWAMVAALKVDNVLALETAMVPIHDKAFERVKRETVEFWKLVTAGTPPKPDYARDARLAAMMIPTTEDALDLSSDNRLPEMLDERERLKAEADGIDARLKEIDDEIRQKVGEHALAVLPGWKITSKVTQRKGYEVKPTTFRPLRVTRLKGVAA